MGRQRLSASWLSADMAFALAASCPPLQIEDVLWAADELSQRPSPPDIVVEDGLFRADCDGVKLRNIVVALHALHDRIG